MITLYTTHCPKCKVLETKLAQKNIEYVEVADEDEIIKLGFQAVPVVEVDGKIMDYVEAVKWINGL